MASLGHTELTKLWCVWNKLDMHLYIGVMQYKINIMPESLVYPLYGNDQHFCSHNHEFCHLIKCRAQKIFNKEQITIWLSHWLNVIILLVRYDTGQDPWNIYTCMSLLTLWGASCSDTSHWRSEALGSCFSENFLSKLMATDSAEIKGTSI